MSYLSSLINLPVRRRRAGEPMESELPPRPAPAGESIDPRMAKLHSTESLPARIKMAATMGENESPPLGPRPVAPTVEPQYMELPLQSRAEMIEALARDPSADPLGPRPETLTIPDPASLAPGEPRLVTMERASPSYKRYRDSVRGMPTEEEYLAERRPEGFGQRLWSGVKTFGKGLVASGGNPISATIGAIASGFDPDTEARLSYRAFKEPIETARQNRDLSRAGVELGFEGRMRDDERADEALRLGNERYLGERDFRERELGFRRNREAVDTQIQLAELGFRLSQAKSEQERRRIQDNIERVKLFGLFGEEVDPDVAEAAGVASLGGARKPQTERNTPQSVYEGQAISAILARRGIADVNAPVPNPKYKTAYDAALAAAGGNVEELNKSINYGAVKLPPTHVPAHETISPEEVKAEAAKLYGGDQGGRGRSAPTSYQSRYQARLKQAQQSPQWSKLTKQQQDDFVKRLKSAYGVN